MIIYIFGNGNISFEAFAEHYMLPLHTYVGCANCRDGIEYVLGDFRGVDTLMMEYLKNKTSRVQVLHVGKRPRYLPDKYGTFVVDWKIRGDFENDEERDNFAIERCTHFIAADFNSNQTRKSGTQKNIERCLELGKIRIR